ITDLKTKIDKSGRTMAFFRLDDFSGSCECLMFSKIYEQFGKYIQEEECIFIIGKPESSGDAIKLQIEKVLSPEEARSAFTESLGIFIDKEKNGKDCLQKLREVIEQNEGNLPFFIHLINNGSKPKIFQFKDKRVNLNESLLTEITQILGEESVILNSKKLG